MYFSAAFLSTLLSFTAAAALTVDEVITNLSSVTDVSAELTEALSPLSVQASAADVQVTTQTNLNQFAVIVQDLNTYLPEILDTPPFDGVGGSTVAPIFNDFVQTQEEMLSVVIDKHGIMAQFGSSASAYAAALNTLKDVLDSFTLSMISLIPTEESTVRQRGAELENAVTAAIVKYEQTCVRSPLYPAVQPVCSST